MKRNSLEPRDALAMNRIGIGSVRGLRAIGTVVWTGMEPHNRAERRALARLERRRVKREK